MKIRKKLTLIIISLISTSAMGQIFLNWNGGVAEYSFTGSLINSSLIPGVSLLGSDNNGNLFTVSGNTIGEYRTSGAVVNANLIPNAGAIASAGFAVSGGYIYFVNGIGTVEQFTSSGSLVNDSLISGVNGLLGLAVSGNNIYVTRGGGNGNNNGVVAQYTTSGVLINASLYSGLEIPGVSVNNGNLYVIQQPYVPALGGYASIDGIISIQGSIVGLAFDGGGNLFVAANLYPSANSPEGVVQEYNSNGQPVNLSLINLGVNTAISGPIVVVPVPEPSVGALAVVALTLIYLRLPLKRLRLRT